MRNRKLFVLYFNRLGNGKEKAKIKLRKHET